MTIKTLLEDDTSLDYLSNAECIPYTPDEEAEAFNKFKNLPDCKEKENLRSQIIMHNQKLVLSIAKRYKATLITNFSLEDMINEGNIGLMIAIDKFDLSLGYKFSTYATWWIKQAILRSFIQKNNMIRIPDYLRPIWMKISSFISDYYAKYNINPTDEEILKNIKGLTKDNLNDYYTYMEIAKDTISLNTKTSSDNEEGEASELGDFIFDTENCIEDEIIEELASVQFQEKINKMLNTAVRRHILTERDVSVFKLRFGFDTDKVQTLQSIGEIYGLSKERIRQIENKTLRYFRCPENIFELKKYMYM